MTDETNTPPAENTNAITDLNQFIELLSSWHSKRVKRLEEILQTPDGTEVTFGDVPAFVLTGDALKGFQVGVALALSQLGHLPFAAEHEPATDDPIH